MLKPRRWTWGRCTPLSTSLCNVATLNNLPLLFHTACFLAGVSGREAELSLLGSGAQALALTILVMFLVSVYLRRYSYMWIEALRRNSICPFSLFLCC